MERVETVTVWDPALRAHHWALAAFVTASWLLGEFGPGIMTWHFWSGYAVAALVAFRVAWGFVGPPAARFSGFLAGPGAVAAYARTLGERRPSGWRGHNPLGGWATVALLALVAAQVATGLVADPEDFINVGPLAEWVAPETRRAAAVWHARLAWALLAVVALHVAAVAYYAVWKREDLIGPMLTGRKKVRRR